MLQARSRCQGGPTSPPFPRFLLPTPPPRPVAARRAARGRDYHARATAASVADRLGAGLGHGSHLDSARIIDGGADPAGRWAAGAPARDRLSALPNLRGDDHGVRPGLYRPAGAPGGPRAGRRGSIDPGALAHVGGPEPNGGLLPHFVAPSQDAAGAAHRAVDPVTGRPVFFHALTIAPGDRRGFGGGGGVDVDVDGDSDDGRRAGKGGKGGDSAALSDADRAYLARARVGAMIGGKTDIQVHDGAGDRGCGRLSYGYALCRGRRPAMEDYHHCSIRPRPARPQDAASEIAPDPGAQPAATRLGLFGVFDGHGGADAAAYVRNRLFGSVLSRLARLPGGSAEDVASATAAGTGRGNDKGKTDATPSAYDLPDPKAVERCLVEAFEETDAAYLADDPDGTRDDGTTAVVAVVAGMMCHVAWCGDSRAVLCSDDAPAMELTRDHKPDRPDERRRVERAGGTVVWAGTWRVGGVLAVSRAFGDRALKEGAHVVATPETVTVNLAEHAGSDSNGTIDVVLASDGLWDVIDAEGCRDIVRGQPSARLAARALVEKAFEEGSADNMSVVVVRACGGGKR